MFCNASLHLARPFVTLRGDMASLQDAAVESPLPFTLGVVGTVLGCLGLYSWMAEDFEDEDDRQLGIARLMLQMSELLVTWLGAVPCLQITLLVTEGTAGRDGSDQHGPDDFLLECRHTKLVTFFHRSQNAAASLATHASASIAFDAEGQAEASTSTRATTFWLIFMFKLS